ncbi:class I SAM-dependent methyltransferase [Leucobacter viscericola]|uniref:class I SAM-dependent methyltransferase n=1 Tax=Leucobacter viscericola TaxID=2714935 RepID=UPI001FCB748A|nr:class I SAM-dependent methyltransferase [Leucobacter viscericola]
MEPRADGVDDVDDVAAVVRHAYANRASEYADVLGNMEATHVADREFVLRWARRCGGPMIDAGCGPGHWTEFLRVAGNDVVGIDPVPEFLAEAALRYPDSVYRRAEMPNLGVAVNSLGGILAWYSLIHVPPAQMGEMLRDLASFLRPGAELALGFFEGASVEPFDHAVVTAYFWPVGELVGLLEDAGFEIVEVESRADPGSRPHGAISARLTAR